MFFSVNHCKVKNNLLNINDILGCIFRVLGKRLVFDNNFYCSLVISISLNAA